MNTPTKDVLLQSPDVKQMIAERAYYISEASGFAAGRDFEFWIQAETEMLLSLSETTVAAPKKATRARKPAAPKTTEAEAKPAPRKRTKKVAE